MPETRSSRGLELADLRRVQWLLGGSLVFVSLGSLLFLQIGAWSLLLAVLLATAIALVRPDLPGRLPLWVHRLAFPAALVVFASELWLTADLFQSLVHLDLMLLLYRGFFYRSRREDLQLILLGLFLLVVAGVVTSSPAFALQLLAFAACALALLFTATIADAAEPGARVRKLPLFIPTFVRSRPNWVEGLNWPELARRVARAFDWRLAGCAVLLFGCVVGVSALLFVSIPRFDLQNSLFLERFAIHRARTGFSDTIRFGDLDEIGRDSSVAFSMDVSNRALIPSIPYFRMLVLDQVLPEGGFRMSPFMRRRLLARDYHAAYLSGDRAAAAAPGAWTFYLEPGVSRYLPLPGRFGTIRFRGLQRLEYDPEDGILALKSDPLSMTAFRLEGVAFDGIRADPRFRRRWQAVPRDPRRGGADLGRMDLGLPLDQASAARLSEWADRIRARTPGRADPRLFALGATDWLHSRHAYALSSAIPQGRGDPLVRWMGSTAPGYCELFAGGLVLLCRAADIPARVVVGFKGGAWNAYSGSFTVRNSDAHAWCEIWDGVGEWIRVDPTPGAIPMAGVAAPAAARVRDWGDERGFSARLEGLRVFWYRRIVSFDARDQENLVRSARDSADAARRRTLEFVDGAMRRLRSAWMVVWKSAGRGAVAAGVAIAVLGLLTAWMLRRRWGGLAPGVHVRARSAEGRIRREAGRWITVLRKRGRWDSSEAGMPDLRMALLTLRFGRPEGWPEARHWFRSARHSSGRRSPRDPRSG